MRRLAVLAASVAVSSSLLIAPAAHAAAPASNGWGWGQLKFADLPAWQNSAVVETLVTARVQGMVEARRAALQPLVETKVISAEQADLISTTNSNAVISAMQRTKEITKAQAVLIRKALAGSKGWPAKQAAIRIALTMLQDSGLITPEQAGAIRAQMLGQ
jgi:hypothetical protein